MKRYRNRLALFKIEAAAGTAEALAAADAILCSDVQLTPLAADSVSREVVRPYFGAQQQLPSLVHATAQMTVELAGSGDAGAAPPWGKLLQACGMAETVTADTSAAYTPVSAGEKTATLAVNIDGVQQTLAGCRGTFSLNLQAGQVPTIQFTFTGHYADPADVAALAANYAAWKDPLPVSKTNTPTFSLMGENDLALSALSLDQGNDVGYREPLAGNAEVMILDRQPSGQITVLAPAISGANLVKTARDASTGALRVVHGTAAGSKIQIDAPKIALNGPTYGEAEGIWTIQTNFQPLPNAAGGNDEFKITNL